MCKSGVGMCELFSVVVPSSDPKHDSRNRKSETKTGHMSYMCNYTSHLKPNKCIIVTELKYCRHVGNRDYV